MPSSIIPNEWIIWGIKYILWSGYNTKFCHGKARNVSGGKSFSITFYVLFLDNKMSVKGRCQNIPIVFDWVDILTCRTGAEFSPIKPHFSTKN